MLYDFFFGYCLFIDNFNHRLAENPQNEKMQSKNKIVNLDLFIDWLGGTEIGVGQYYVNVCM